MEVKLKLSPDVVARVVRKQSGVKELCKSCVPTTIKSVKELCESGSCGRKVEIERSPRLKSERGRRFIKTSPLVPQL